MRRAGEKGALLVDCYDPRGKRLDGGCVRTGERWLALRVIGARGDQQGVLSKARQEAPIGGTALPARRGASGLPAAHRDGGHLEHRGDLPCDQPPLLAQPSAFRRRWKAVKPALAGGSDGGNSASYGHLMPCHASRTSCVGGCAAGAAELTPLAWGQGLSECQESLVRGSRWP